MPMTDIASDSQTLLRGQLPEHLLSRRAASSDRANTVHASHTKIKRSLGEGMHTPEGNAEGDST